MPTKNASQSTAVTTGTCQEFGFTAHDHWAKFPVGCRWTEVTAAATDSQDRVYVFNRGPQPVLIFDRQGNFLSAWEETSFARPHGLFIGPDDSVIGQVGALDYNKGTVHLVEAVAKLKSKLVVNSDHGSVSFRNTSDVQSTLRSFLSGCLIHEVNRKKSSGAGK